jgi:hypothetical protein
LARWVLGVVGECRPGVYRHEVVEELQVARLELHAKGNAWPFGQRLEISVTEDAPSPRTRSRGSL